MFNIAIAQSGGPTAAINATLAGVFARAEKTEEVDEIYGALNGIEGIINDHLINLRHIIMNEEDKDLLMKTPSTILGSCRYKLPSLEEDDLQYKTIVENLQKHHIKVFFYIGGNDSMDTVMKLDAYLKREQIDLCCRSSKDY